MRPSGTRSVETPWASQKNQLATSSSPSVGRIAGGIAAANASCNACRSGLSRNSFSQRLQLGRRSASDRSVASSNRAEFGLGQRLGQLSAELGRTRPPVRPPGSGVPARRRRCGRRIGRRNWLVVKRPLGQCRVRFLQGRVETPARRTTPPRPATAPARRRPTPSSAAGPTARPARPARRAPPARWQTACSGSGARQRSTMAASILSTPRRFRWPDGGGDCSIVCRYRASRSIQARASARIRSTVLPVRCGGPPVNMQYSSAPRA